MNCFSLLPGSASRSQFWPPELRELAHVLISKKEVTRTKKLHLQTDECSDAGIKSNVGPSVSFSELIFAVPIKKQKLYLLEIAFVVLTCRVPARSQQDDVLTPQAVYGCVPSK